MMMTNTVCLTLEEYNKLYEDHIRLQQVESALAEAYGDNADLSIAKHHLEEELKKAQDKNYWWNKYIELKGPTTEGPHPGLTTVATTGSDTINVKACQSEGDVYIG